MSRVNLIEITIETYEQADMMSISPVIDASTKQKIEREVAVKYCTTV